VRATAVVVTDAPARYAKQLLAHLGRKNTVEPDGEGGRLVFSYGVGTVQPGHGQLLLTAEAPGENARVAHDAPALRV
jgi:uncharacterized protein